MPKLGTAIETIHPKHALLASGPLRAFAAPAYEIPSIFPELGRLAGRELDAFDHWYEHLFLWDTLAGKPVGALRLGEVARLVDPDGLHALESARIFDAAVLRGFGAAVEISAAWAEPGHLGLLQRALGAWLAEHPGCRQGLVLARTPVDRALAVGGRVVAVREPAATPVLFEVSLFRFRAEPSWVEARAANE
jgi:hypothetical protein